MRRDRTGAKRGKVVGIGAARGSGAPSRPSVGQTAVTAAANRVLRNGVHAAPPGAFEDVPDAGAVRSPTGAATPIRARLRAAVEPAPAGRLTVAALLGAATGHDWDGFVVERIETWALGYFDAGPVGPRSPWHRHAPFAAWRGEAELDRTPEILGVPAYCAIARTLPGDGDAALLRAAHELGLDARCFERYFEQLLPAVSHWTGRARRGAGDAGARDVVAIRAAWDVVLLDAFERHAPGIASALQRGLTRCADDHDAASVTIAAGAQNRVRAG